MTITNSGIQLSGLQAARLREVIGTRSGIRVPDSKIHVFESRLGTRLAELGMDDFDQYLALLTTGPYQAEEFQELLDRVGINETSFFRDESQLQVLGRQILPVLLDARLESRHLRIWSAGCSTGEEPYTLAIMLHRLLGARLAEWHIEILGTDISERVVRTARTAVYASAVACSIPDAIRAQYLREVDGKWHVRDEIRDLVSFQVHNLNDTMSTRARGTWDVILCRNVMMYFDQARRARVVRTFYEHLAGDGVLIVGRGEHTDEVTELFEEERFSRGNCFVKRLRGSGEESQKR